MTKIKVINNGNKVLMIDGYVTSEINLKERVNKLAEVSGIPASCIRMELHHYFRKGRKFSENAILLFFRQLVYRFRENYCPYKFTKKTENGEIFSKKACHYQFFSTKQNYYSIETLLRDLPKYEKKNIAHILPVLQEEFKNDVRLGKSRYAQNIIFYRNCDIADACCENWAKELNFNIKIIEEYKDFTSFRNVWVDCLNYLLGYYVQRL